MIKGFFVFYLGFLCLHARGKVETPAFSSADFKKVLQKYAGNSGVRMNFTKITRVSLLNKIKKSKGEIVLSRGAFVLRLSDQFRTRILFDKKDLWYITAPPGEKPQKERISTGFKTPLSVLFQPEKLFAQFQFVSSRPKGRTWVLDFVPAEGGPADIRSFSVKVDKDRILTVWIKWKNPDNEEEYRFSHIRFHQEITPSVFAI